MLASLLRLQWLAFVRAPFLGGRIALASVKLLGVAYAVVMAAMLGFLLPDTLSVWAPEVAVSALVAAAVLPALGGLTVLRLLFQQLPTRGATAFLLLPVSRRRVAAGVLARSTVSVLNVVPVAFAVPFAARTVRAEMGGAGALGFVVSMVALVLLSHLVLVVWKARLGDAPALAVGTALGVTAAVLALDLGTGGLIEAAWTGSALLPAGLAFAATAGAFAAYRMVVASLYLDGAPPRRTRGGRGGFARGGTRAFVEMDLRMIARTRFPRAIAINAVAVSLFLSGFALTGGLSPIAWLVLVLSSGTVAGSFGQFALSYASAHYDGLLVLPGGLRAFVRARLLGIAAASLGLGVLTLGLVLAMHPPAWTAVPASVLFSAGVLGPVAVLGSTLGPKPLDLTEPLMFNYKVNSFGAQVVIGATFVVLGALFLAAGPTVGVAVVTALGGLGVIALPAWARLIEARLVARRHAVAARFRGGL